MKSNPKSKFHAKSAVQISDPPSTLTTQPSIISPPIDSVLKVIERLGDTLTKIGFKYNQIVYLFVLDSRSKKIQS